MKSFQNLKVRTRLIILVVFAFISVLILIGVSFYNLNNLRDASTTSYDTVIVPNSYLRDVSNSYSTIRVLIRDYPIGVLIDDDAYLIDDVNTIVAHDKIVDEALNNYLNYVEQNNIQGEEREAILRLEEQYKKIQPLVESINELALAKDMEALLAAILNEFDELNPTMRDTLYQLNDINKSKAENTQTKTHEIYNGAYSATIIFIIISTIILIVTAVFIIESIIRPIHYMINITKDITDGNLNVNMIKYGNSEMGILVNYFGKLINTFTNLVEDMGNLAKRHAHGDTAARIDASKYAGTYSQMATNLNTMLESYTSLIDDMLHCIKCFGEGNFNVELNEVSKKNVAIDNAMLILGGNLSNISTDIMKLVNAAAKGNLSERVDSSHTTGDWSTILNSLNGLMENIASPIKEAANAIEQVAHGNFDTKMIGDYQGDFLLIKNSINNTITNIAFYIDEISHILVELSNDNLDQDIRGDYVGKFFNIKMALNRIVDKFNNVISNISVVSDQVSTGAQHISNSSSILADAAADQVNSIEQLTAVVEVIHGNTIQNAKNAKDMEELSIKSKLNATSGSKAMEDMLLSIKSIREASQGISKIIKVIEDIAFQTNLLALNASVEAARAGEHGKGFAVVAEEVRNLAGRSQTAASETTELIEKSINKVDIGTKMAEETASAFHTIVSDVDKLGEITIDISTASNEQASAISRVTKNISCIADITCTASSSSKESSATAEELFSQVEMLQNTVKVFRLKKH